MDKSNFLWFSTVGSNAEEKKIFCRVIFIYFANIWLNILSRHWFYSFLSCYFLCYRWDYDFLVVCVYQVNYGNFMHGLMKENIQLNRKVLSELSMHEPYSFKALVDISRNAFPGNKNVVLPPKKEGISIVL